MIKKKMWDVHREGPVVFFDFELQDAVFRGIPWDRPGN